MQVVQGTASDLMKKAMVNVDTALRELQEQQGEGYYRCECVLQVHDELVYEVSEVHRGPAFFCLSVFIIASS